MYFIARTLKFQIVSTSYNMKFPQREVYLAAATSRKIFHPLPVAPLVNGEITLSRDSKSSDYISFLSKLFLKNFYQDLYSMLRIRYDCLGTAHSLEDF